MLSIEIVWLYIVQFLFAYFLGCVCLYVHIKRIYFQPFSDYSRKLKKQEFFEASITLISKTETLPENYKPISLNIGAKIINKILVNQMQQYISKIIHHNSRI